MLIKNHQKKWFLIAFVGVVLVFVGIQFYWLVDKGGSIMQILSILTSIALIWTLALLAIAADENNSTIRLKNSELEDDPQILVGTSTCSVEADEYFSDIKEELGQAGRLVGDAVNNLVMNFNYISKLTSSHHSMVMAIEKMAAPQDNEQVVQLLKRQMKIAEKIEQELAAAVTSLQFGDLVTQLLGHTSHRIDALYMSLQRIDRGNMGQSGGRSLSEFQHDIAKAVNEVKHKGKNKPVVQQGMHGGEVDLF